MHNVNINNLVSIGSKLKNILYKENHLVKKIIKYVDTDICHLF